MVGCSPDTTTLPIDHLHTCLCQRYPTAASETSQGLPVRPTAYHGVSPGFGTRRIPTSCSQCIMDPLFDGVLFLIFDPLNKPV